MIFLFEIIKKKERRPMHKIFILQVVISPLARLDLHFFEIRTYGTMKNGEKKIPLLGTIIVVPPTIFEIISLSFFFFSQIGVGDNFKKKSSPLFIPLPEVRVSFARDASLEAHIPFPSLLPLNLPFEA